MGGTWPDPFAILAYQPVGVEMQVDTIVNGAPRRVVPELICASSTENHVFVLEAKSATVNDRQAKAYEAMTADDLLTQGLLPPGVDPNSLSSDSIYVCSTENAERMTEELAVAGVALPLIVGDSERFKLVDGSITHSILHRTFEEGIDVLGYQWPMHFVPMNSRASIGEIAAVVIRTAVSFLLTDQQFTADEIGAKSIAHCDICGGAEQQSFRRKITDVLAEAGADELSDYFVRLHPRQAWERKAERHLSGRSLDRISELAEEYVFRKQNGMPYRLGQPRLIPESLME